MVWTALRWLLSAYEIVLFVYLGVQLVRRRREESVRRLTRLTAIGLGVSVLIAAALIASTLLI